MKLVVKPKNEHFLMACNKCQCKFLYNHEDLDTIHGIYCLNCPECGALNKHIDRESDTKAKKYKKAIKTISIQAYQNYEKDMQEFGMVRKKINLPKQENKENNNGKF